MGFVASACHQAHTSTVTMQQVEQMVTRTVFYDSLTELLKGTREMESTGWAVRQIVPEISRGTWLVVYECNR